MNAGISLELPNIIVLQRFCSVRAAASEFMLPLCCHLVRVLIEHFLMFQVLRRMTLLRSKHQRSSNW